MRIENEERNVDAMNKKKAEYRLGAYTKRLLMMVFPLIIVQLVALIALIAPLEGSELLKNQELIHMFFHGIGRGLAFMTIGGMILDYFEKKNEKRDG